MASEIRPSFTQDEAQVLINLINIALKATGLEAAEAAVLLTKKITEAAKIASNGMVDVNPPSANPNIDGVSADKAVIN